MFTYCEIRRVDRGNRAPLQVVPIEQQRAALKFVVETAFQDEIYALTPELLERMTTSKKLGGSVSSAMRDYDWPIHDRVGALQASTLTSVLNPTTLRRVYDNEFRIPADQDALTLPEVLDTVTGAIWGELGAPLEAATSVRKPAISSLRRNLQREHVNRLIDLSMTNNEVATNRLGRFLTSPEFSCEHSQVGSLLTAKRMLKSSMLTVVLIWKKLKTRLPKRWKLISLSLNNQF